MQHSEACRARIELALGQTHRGRERLEHTKLRFDKRRAALAGAQDDAQLEPAGVEGEMIGTSALPTNLDNDYEMREVQDSENSQNDEMSYSPASLGTPMSVQQRAQCTELVSQIAITIQGEAVLADRQSALHGVQQLASLERGPTGLDNKRRQTAAGREAATRAVLL